MFKKKNTVWSKRSRGEGKLYGCIYINFKNQAKLNHKGKG